MKTLHTIPVYMDDEDDCPSHEVVVDVLPHEDPECCRIKFADGTHMPAMIKDACRLLDIDFNEAMGMLQKASSEGIALLLQAQHENQLRS